MPLLPPAAATILCGFFHMPPRYDATLLMRQLPPMPYDAADAAIDITLLFSFSITLIFRHYDAAAAAAMITFTDITRC